METIEKLRAHYISNPPRPSYGGSEGSGFTALAFIKYPHEEETKPMGVRSVVVWQGRFPAIRDDLPVERYCVINVCLDSWGTSIPEAFPLLPEMEGHALFASIYVDMYGRIFARAIGGATTHSTRNAVPK